MYNKITILLLSVVLSAGVSAQFTTPVTISAETPESARAGEVVLIRVTAAMDQQWHIYALRKVGEGPIASKVFVTSEAVEEVGRVTENEPIEIFDKGFQTVTRYHQGGAEFTVPLLLRSDLAAGTYPVNLKVLYQVCDASLCYPPREEEIVVDLIVESGAARTERTGFVSEERPPPVISASLGLDEAIGAGFFSFVFLALSMGFLALLTPCVFPMIPITVSFFTHQGETSGRSPLKQALVYTLGIIMTFSLLGMFLAITLGASGANQLAANPWVNLFIGSLFVYFSLSLFGMYEIQLPASLRQFSLNQESRSGYIGVLFMAVTFTLTSFTCTVQFVGLLLVAAAQGLWFWPMLGMVVFSTAFAAPFFFLALFPQYLAKMPKSGGWLNSVKVTMGFLELAAAFKFFSNTDLVWGWGFFSHKMVLASWAIIMVMAGIYLLGKIRLPHDSNLDVVGVPRMMISLAFLVMGLYLSSGLYGQKIHGLIYAYLPPVVVAETGSVTTNGVSIAEEFAWYNDLEEGLSEARRTGRPVFIDFTGYTCTNCRWMEANVFTKPDVKDRFGEMILVQLYTDAGTNFKENQQYEIERFGTAALPFYVMLSPENEIIATFPGLSRNLDDFLNFLDMGLAG
ncbi:MAG: cytochrome c biogenesis protein CcdA [Candidatus Neomarinimicrobiota bacterium]